MRLVKVGNNYIRGETLRYIRNHSELKKCFISQKDISEFEQIKYIDKHGENYYICIDHNVAIGFIGVVDRDLRIAVLPTHQNKGYGTFMIKKLKKMKVDFEVKVKKENIVSQNFFKKLKIPYKLV